MIIKENLRPYGRLLNRYLASLEIIKEISKGVNRFNWPKIQKKFYFYLMPPLSEFEIITRLKEMEKECLFTCGPEFKKYLKRAYGISKLPK